MSFFGRGNASQPSQPNGSPYSRVPADYNSLPPGSRSNIRQPAPGYNDPSAALFESRSRPSAPPSRGPQGNTFDVAECPSDALALSNCLVVHPDDFQQGSHVILKGQYPVTVRHDNTGRLRRGVIGASSAQRQWIGLSRAGDYVDIETLPSPPNPSAPTYLESVDFEVDFLRKNVEVAEAYSADEMSQTLMRAFNGIMFTQGQTIVFEFHGQNLKALVKSITLLHLAEEQTRGAAPRRNPILNNTGIMMDKTDINVVKGASSIKIKSSGKKAPPNAIISPNFKFQDMGIGGLDSEFSSIFRRAFASRVFPPSLVEKLGIQHVKGILLHGPPGTGKTLLARQIGKMLNAREPKVVNGPEILSKFVGASEENIRKLFADAEKEYKEKGDESGLHIIIFDELDAIFKQRGSTNNGTGVGDTVVNQLLSKMDGVDQLNNILIIGMTNRKDMIDEALLRPGRLEVHMEISLPDEKGRIQILNIHTAKMRSNNVLDDDVDIEELATMTKNFSGAEIGGLIKSATSFAFNRHVKVGTMAGISEDVENLRVNRGDFMHALEEVHPAFGVSEEELRQVVQNGIIHYDASVDEMLRTGNLFVEQVRTSTRTPLVTVLLHGPAGSGKTALAATIASSSQFPFIKLISPDNMVGFGESQKVSAISKIFSDSYKSPLSVIVVDNIERLLDWTPIGPRFSNSVLQTLLVLFAKRPPKDRRLLIIVTSSQRPVLTDVGLAETFDSELRVPPISSLSALDYVLREVKLFPTKEAHREALDMLSQAGFGAEGRSGISVGIKKLLSMIEMARQEPDNTALRLASALSGLGM